MYCRQCGQKIDDNDKFCFKCGCELEQSAEKEDVQLEESDEIHALRDIVINKEQYTKSKLMEVEQKLHELNLVDLESEIHNYIIIMDDFEQFSEKEEGVADFLIGLVGKLIISVVIVLVIVGLLTSHKCENCGKITFTKYSFDGNSGYLCNECAIDVFFPFDSNNFRVKWF